MGLQYSPDITQAVKNVTSSIDAAEVYIDDVGAFSPSQSQEHHIELFSTVV